MDVALLLDEVDELLNEAAMIACEQAPGPHHAIVGPILLADGLVKTVRRELERT